MARKAPIGNTAPALGNDGGKGKGTHSHGHLLLPFPSDRTLSPMEAMFVVEFLKDPTASLGDIAVRAGYSKRTAQQQGNQIMNRPNVQAEIADQMHAFVQRQRLSIERIVRFLIELSEVDKREYHNEDGSIKNPKEWTKAEAALVKSFTVSEIWDTPGSPKKIQIGEMKKITLSDPLSAITLLTKSLQNFTEKVDIRKQSIEKHEHTHTIKHALDIDFNVLTPTELHTLKEIYTKAKNRTSNNIRVTGNREIRA